MPNAGNFNPINQSGKNMKKTTLLATALATTFGIQAEMPQLHFTLLKNGNYGEGTVTATPGNGFKMTLKNTEKRNHAIALANFKLNAAAQQKLESVHTIDFFSITAILST